MLKFVLDIFYYWFRCFGGGEVVFYFMKGGLLFNFIYSNLFIV